MNRFFERPVSLGGDNRPQSPGGVLRGIPDPQDFAVDTNTDSQTIYQRFFTNPYAHAITLPPDTSSVEILPVSDYDACWLAIDGESIPTVNAGEGGTVDENINDGGTGTEFTIGLLAHKVSISSPWYRGKNKPATIRLLPYYAPNSGATAPTKYSTNSLFACRIWRNPAHRPLPGRMAPYQRYIAGATTFFVPVYGRDAISLYANNPAGAGTLSVTASIYVVPPNRAGGAGSSIIQVDASAFTVAAGATAFKDIRTLFPEFRSAHFVSVLQASGNSGSGVFVDARPGATAP